MSATAYGYLVGTRVITKSKLTDKPRGFTNEMVKDRRPSTEGKVVRVSDSHGLAACLEHDDGALAWYQFDELENIQCEPKQSESKSGLSQEEQVFWDASAIAAMAHWADYAERNLFQNPMTRAEFAATVADELLAERRKRQV